MRYHRSLCNRPEDIGRKAIRIEDIVIFNGNINNASRDLIFRKFYPQYFFFGECQFFQNYDITIIFLERRIGV